MDTKLTWLAKLRKAAEPVRRATPPQQQGQQAGGPGQGAPGAPKGDGAAG